MQVETEIAVGNIPAIGSTIPRSLPRLAVHRSSLPNPSLSEQATLELPQATAAVAMQAAGANGGTVGQTDARQSSSPVMSVELDLATWQWGNFEGTESERWHEQPGQVTVDLLHSMPFMTKGRKSTDAKEAEHQAEEVLRRRDWHITASTSVEEIESLVTILVKWYASSGFLIQMVSYIAYARSLDHWCNQTVQIGARAKAWCVGGSLAETLKARDANGNAHALRFIGCHRSRWVAYGSNAKIGNTCKFHCRVPAKNVWFGGRLWTDITLKKCTWCACQTDLTPVSTMRTRTERRRAESQDEVLLWQETLWFPT
eukprot:SAG31_NODE_3528_length_4153_cov_1.648249_2_plen_314_part_00